MKKEDWCLIDDSLDKTFYHLSPGLSVTLWSQQQYICARQWHCGTCVNPCEIVSMFLQFNVSAVSLLISIYWLWL